MKVQEQEKQMIQTTDKAFVPLGATVWCNHTAEHEKPTPAKLTGVLFLDDDNTSWPYLVSFDWKDGKGTRTQWAKVYSTREAAIKDDPLMEIQQLRHRLNILEKSLQEKQSS